MELMGCNIFALFFAWSLEKLRPLGPRVDNDIKKLVQQSEGEKQPFLGNNELFGSPHNGNFVGIQEVISQFDIFLTDHISMDRKVRAGAYLILLNLSLSET